MVGKVAGFQGKISNDPTKPDGTMRKLMDVRRFADMDWTAKVALGEGVAKTYQCSSIIRLLSVVNFPKGTFE